MDFETRLVVFVQQEGVVCVRVFSSDELLFGKKYLLLSSYDQAEFLLLSSYSTGVTTVHPSQMVSTAPWSRLRCLLRLLWMLLSLNKWSIAQDIATPQLDIDRETLRREEQKKARDTRWEERVELEADPEKKKRLKTRHKRLELDMLKRQAEAAAAIRRRKKAELHLGREEAEKKEAEFKNNKLKEEERAFKHKHGFELPRLDEKTGEEVLVV